jgi:HlyD family secretion protein
MSALQEGRIDSESRSPVNFTTVIAPLRSLARLPAVLGLAIAAVICLTSCKDPKAKQSSAEQKIPTAPSKVEDLDFSIQVIGDLRPSLQVDVKAEISGRIKKIHSKIGETINAGDLVIELDDTDILTEKATALIEIEGTKLALTRASMAAERAKKLLLSQLVSQEEADNKRIDAEIAENNMQKAMKRLQAAEDKLKKTRITAPINGMAIAVPVVQGQVVVGGTTASKGTLLMTLANLSEMLISTHITQLDVVKIQAGQNVDVTVDAFDELKLMGEVFFIAPVASIKNNVKGFSVDVLVSKPDPRVKPGMSANVRLELARAAGALTVPVEAIFREKQKSVVFIEGQEGFEKREVKVGLTTTERAQILSGLEVKERVALTRPPGMGRKPKA